MRIIAVLDIVLMFILFIPFYITIKINRKNDNDNIAIGLIIFRIIRLDYEIPFMDIISSKGQVGIEINKKIEEQSSKKDIIKDKEFLKLDDIIRIYKEIKKNKEFYQAVSYYILDKIEIKKINWSTRIGTDDAAITAIISGFFWFVESSILSILFRNKYINDYYINVFPEFRQSVFEIDVYCIFKLKLVYIIIAGYKGIKVKIKGGGLNVWTSNRRFNENYDG